MVGVPDPQFARAATELTVRRHLPPEGINAVETLDLAHLHAFVEGIDVLDAAERPVPVLQEVEKGRGLAKKGVRTEDLQSHADAAVLGQPVEVPDGVQDQLDLPHPVFIVVAEKIGFLVPGLADDGGDAQGMEFADEGEVEPVGQFIELDDPFQVADRFLAEDLADLGMQRLCAGVASLLVSSGVDVLEEEFRQEGVSRIFSQIPVGLLETADLEADQLEVNGILGRRVRGIRLRGDQKASLNSARISVRSASRGLNNREGSDSA